MNYVIIVSALWMLLMVFIVTGYTPWASFFYRVLPLILSLILIAHAVKNLGWLAFL